MYDSKFMKLLTEYSESLDESAGQNGLYNRYKQEKAKSDINVSENKIRELEESKKGIMSKNKLSDIDKKISNIRGDINKSKRDEDYFKRRDDKKHNSFPRNSIEFNKLKKNNNVDKSVMSSIIRKKENNKKLNDILSEAIDLLEEGAVKQSKKHKLDNYLAKYNYKGDKKRGTIIVNGKTYNVDRDTKSNTMIVGKTREPRTTSSNVSTKGIPTIYLDKDFEKLKNNKRRDAVLNHEIGHANLHHLRNENTKAALMSFVEKEIKKIDEYLSKIEPYKNDENEEDIDESTILENAFMTKNDLYKDFDKFENGESNILLITGLTGSGKSTLAQQICSKYNAEYIELDKMDPYSNLFKQRMDTIRKAGEVFYDYFNSHKNMYEKLISDQMSKKDIVLMMDDILKYCFSWCSKRKNKRFVIEGIQIYDFFNYYKTPINYPIIIKGTSVIKSFLRKIKREKWNAKGLIKSAPDCLKMMVKDDKQLKNLADSLNEYAILEAKSKIDKNFKSKGYKSL